MVVNDIRVQVEGAMERGDIEIAQAVRHALDWDVRVPSSQIRSTVADGWVTLDGDVGAWYERDAAEHAVRHLAGVRGVINAIDVNLPYVKTETIRDEIEQALERRAIREVRHIEIDVQNGVVTLTGPVQSWAEREAVIGAARYNTWFSGCAGPPALRAGRQASQGTLGHRGLRLFLSHRVTRWNRSIVVGNSASCVTPGLRIG